MTRSQRIKKAVKGITGKCSTELTNDLVREGSSSRRKRGVIPSGPEECKPENCSDGKISSTRKASKQPRRQKTESQNMQSGDGGGKSFIPDEGGRNDKSGLSANVRGRRGMGRGSGRGKGRGREEKPTYESTEGSSSDDCYDTCEMEKHIQAPGATSELGRHQKHVKYAEENAEINDGSEEATVEQEPVEVGCSVGVGDVSSDQEGSTSSSLMLPLTTRVFESEHGSRVRGLVLGIIGGDTTTPSDRYREGTVVQENSKLSTKLDALMGQINELKSMLLELLDLLSGNAPASQSRGGPSGGASA